MAEIRIKRVTLHSIDKDAIIKIKLTKEEAAIEVLIEEIKEFYTFRGNKQELVNKRMLKESEDKILSLMSAEKSQESFRFDLKNNKVFEITKLQPYGDDSEDQGVYEIVCLRLPNMNKIELSPESFQLVLRQFEDFEIISNNMSQNISLLQCYETDFKDLNEQFIKIVSEKEELEKKVVEKCLELINEKKKVIASGMDVSRHNESSLDLDNFPEFRNIAAETKQEMEVSPEQKKSHPVASTSTFAIKQSPKSASKPKRTPSKKLFAQLQEKDSDDDFDVLPLNDSIEKPTRKRKSQDPTSIFSNVKIKTPKKAPEREEKESSLELKTEKEETFRPRAYTSNSSEIESRSSLENAQRIIDEKKSSSRSVEIFNTAPDNEMECDEIQFSQVIEDDEVDIEASFTQRRKAKKNKKSQKDQDPYEVKTVNILDM